MLAPDYIPVVPGLVLSGIAWAVWLVMVFTGSGKLRGRK